MVPGNDDQLDELNDEVKANYSPEGEEQKLKESHQDVRNIAEKAHHTMRQSKRDAHGAINDVGPAMNQAKAALKGATSLNKKNPQTEHQQLKGQALTEARKAAWQNLKNQHELRKTEGQIARVLGDNAKKKIAARLVAGVVGTASGGTALVIAGVAELAFKHKKLVIGAALALLLINLTLIFIFISMVLCLKKFVGGGPIGIIGNVISAIVGNKSCSNPEDIDNNTVNVTKTGPVEVKNPDGKGPDLKYTIKVDYQGQAQDIIITDDIILNSNVTFVSATGTHTTTPPGDGPDVKSITWSAANQGENKAGGQTFTADGTGYYPANTKLEGGPLDMQGTPLRTLQDFLTGKVIEGKVTDYVSVAMDKTAFPYGTELTILELDQKYGKHIPFRVVDTGSAFIGKGMTRIDICTANEKASLDPTVNGKLTIKVGNAPSGSSFSNLSFDVVFRPKDANSYVVNKATATIIGAFTGSGTNTGDPGADTTGYAAPSDDRCGKTYTDAIINKSSMKKNFGDPTCNYSKDKLFALLQKEDPKNARYWFDTVIKCESGYNANAYAGHVQTGTPDSSGAWGLYQMGSSKPPGSAPPAKGKNGAYDRGDVNWQIQTTNAINYRDKTIGGKWTYWACAKSKW